MMLLRNFPIPSFVAHAFGMPSSAKKATPKHHGHPTPTDMLTRKHAPLAAQEHSTPQEGKPTVHKEVDTTGKHVEITVQGEKPVAGSQAEADLALTIAKELLAQNDSGRSATFTPNA
ncbi:MAG: hypothetical protein ACKO37_06870 [Vampirovibrionales bacterium]